ncbi:MULTISPECIES: hypothetical protein [Nostoc]|uniref:Uncharacterized protein n=2 Tax=Nostoc TaxID=1177 RepID=A0ABR8IJ11_9NOSO|nr:MULTISPECIES: hypothetical protein [Nostoc]MBD2566266.1 hypothetical protein [Nostoc linckia FACHB-391]MBD2650952.1 hypothetical protein [Nostoc foliaceum FACHB-393]
MAKIVVSSWESEGYGHSTHREQEIDSQYQKMREISDQLGINIPDLDIYVGSLSTRTQIIADESVLDYVDPIYYSEAD